ncbi:putative oxidoreductase [Rhypophila decipiens]|uniref:Oxidoreductase n=1 Tax=Rhypophila decipiens TaxID=261697 RepID=A0AAN6YJ30_9PEZI|nr:putative oxidoreductase [Rhypophila decipiens]
METNTLGWHLGEVSAHKLLKVATSNRRNPTQQGLSYSHGYRVSESPIVALGTLDQEGNIWTTLWGGEKGFARPVAKNVLALQSLLSVKGDPFLGALLELDENNGNNSLEGGGVIKPAGEGKMMSGLSVDLETRDRVKLAGRVLVASLDNNNSGESERAVREMQLAMVIDEGLGNCPKYMNRKEIHAHVPNPTVIGMKGGVKLTSQALGLIEQADMMFLSTTNGKTMDTNHRGGPAGFIRVLRNQDGEVILVYPEYSGNQLYQSIGNLQVDNRIGVVIPDFETSDVLYLTGETELLVGLKAAAVMPHAKVVVKIKVKEARFVKDGLPFRGVSLDRSPYNPPVRRLASEGLPGVVVGDDEGDGPVAIATLVKRHVLSPTIARYTFKLRNEKGRPIPAWKPAQYVTLDFGGELDQGWSHMREDDPQSLNDDFVRTFTVSNCLPEEMEEVTGEETELEITVRRHGPTTGFLWDYKFQVPLELPVLGFGGEDSFRIPTATGGGRSVFVAGGVGITPLLAQAPGLIKADADFILLWSLRSEDLGVVVDSLQRIPGLAQRTRLFVTGVEAENAIEKVNCLGTQGTFQRRLLQQDVLAVKEGQNGTKYYLCASPAMQTILEGWLQGEDFVSESFGY